MTILRIKNSIQNDFVDLPPPSTFQWDIMDVDGEEGTGRDKNGDAFRDRIATKRKLICEWGPLSMEMMSFLLKNIKDEFFELEFPDAEEGERIVKTFYVGDRSAPMYHYDAETSTPLWEGLTCNFVEQ